MEGIKRWARELNAQLLVVWFCRSHPDTPIAAKLLARFVVAYAFSPIDLIPAHVIADARTQADARIAARKSGPRNYLAGVAVGALWIAIGYWSWILLADWMGMK